MHSDYSELAANIRNYIKQYKSISLNGIGVLYADTIEIYNISDTSYIIPSSEKYRLILDSKSQVEDRFIANAHFDVHLIKSYLNLSEKIKSLKSDSEIIKLPGIGNLFFENNSIHFECDTNSGSNQWYGLPAINFNPISTIKADSTEVENKYKVTEKRYSKVPQLINILSTAAIFLLLVFAYHNWPSDLNFERNRGADIKKVQIDHSRLNQKPEKVLIDNNELPQSLIPGNIEKENKVASCALILGSFAKKQNAVLLQSQILDYGYELYTEEFHEFYRVGVSINCEKIKGEVFQKIKSNLGIDPWLRIY